MNGAAVELGYRYQDGDLIRVDDKLVENQKQKETWVAYHKKVGIESTFYSQHNSRTLAFLEEELDLKLIYLGRLDKESQGLMLFTTEGDWVNPIMKSQNNHEKEYIVETANHISDEELLTLEKGIDIGDEFPTKKARTERKSQRIFHMTITEGRKRQIRRMLEAIEHKVVSLERIRIVCVELGELAYGEWRYLEENEILALKEECAPQEKEEAK